MVFIETGVLLFEDMASGQLWLVTLRDAYLPFFNTEYFVSLFWLVIQDKCAD